MTDSFDYVEILWQLLETTGLLIWVIFKFLFAPSTLYLLDYGFWPTIAYSIVGGWLGVFAFYYGGKAFFRWMERNWPAKKKKKKFTELNKMIVRFKRNYGLNGLAVLLGIGSIPIISLVAAKYYQHDKKTIVYLIVSVVIWSFILTGGTAGIASLFHPD